MNPICSVGMIFPSACQDRESPVTPGSLCSGGWEELLLAGGQDLVKVV